ncbi:MAG TPA: ATP-binding cassette domain-containing protein, partial [Mycobacteriales bacterium]|nr:ATP-binding cassette domain-containing protein [Mycobacteriales bacterium]
YTGLHSDPDRISLPGGPQPISNPPGGEPKAISSIPGAGLLSSRLVTEIPGQSAQFISAPLRRKLRIVGAGTVRLQVSSSERAATFFVKLYDIGPDGDRELPGGAVAPVQLENLDRARTVTVQLPAIAHDFPADHQLAVVVSATDQGYSGPRDERRYQVKLTGPLIAPTLRARLVDGPSATWPWAAAAAGILLAGILALVIGGRRRRRASTADSGPPVVVDRLRKSYGDQVTAVAGVSFTVEPGQILGLLGPTGAGKTTTLRMLLGLITPSGGQIRLFGSRVGPGAPVLGRVGALVEGPGLLPHLSGMDNLRLFWRATGRPEPEAEFDEVLRIARLGPAVERRVRTYSHGMRQRLAIAQAMLGLPDLLVLDEPTNGLDPPQIRDLRGVLQDYVAGGRTVVVSSHLLGEVEQTCTHVVVMDRGRVAAAGTVAQIIGTGDTLVIATDDLDRSLAILGRLPGVREVSHDGAEITVTLEGAGPGQLTAALVAAGLEVRKIAPRRRLEDAFVTLVGEGTV